MPPQMTPEQIATDEAEIKKVKERNLAARAAEAAKEKIAEASNTHDFSNELYSNKALQREEQIKTLRKEIAEM